MLVLNEIFDACTVYSGVIVTAVVRFDSHDDDVVGLDVQYLFVFSMPHGVPAFPTATGPPATARPRHTVALGASGKRGGAAVELGERGARKGALLGTACSLPGMGGGSPGREGFP